MHRCLTILDVLLLIFADVEKHTLARLAATCKLFSEPALDLLWENQDGLTPLLKTMAPGLWAEVRAGNRYRLDIQRPIVPVDWARFHLYRSRVKSLNWSLFDIGQNETFAFLFASPTPLFPNLRNLSLDLIHNETFPFVNFLLGPTLMKFDISWDEPSNVIPSLLYTLHTKCPDIKVLHVSAPKEDTRAVCDTLSTWKDLKDFRSEELTAKAVVHLSAMPALHSLEFQWYPSEDDTLPILPLPDQPAFPALCILSIDMMVALPTHHDIIDIFQHSPLQDVRFYQPTKEYLGSSLPWRTFFRRFSTRSSHDSLISIQIEGEDAGEDDPPLHYMFRSDTLRPLYLFQNIEMFDCGIASGLDLDDADVEEMARSWPSLQALRLIGLYTPMIYSRVTFTGLSTLVKFCPNLSVLEIAIDARTINPSLVAVDNGARANLAIKKINVGHSPLADTAMVAKALSILFPNIRGINTLPHSHYFPQWREVGRDLAHRRLSCTRS